MQACLLVLRCVIAIFEKEGEVSTWHPITVLWLCYLVEESSEVLKGLARRYQSDCQPGVFFKVHGSRNRDTLRSTGGRGGLDAN